MCDIEAGFEGIRTEELSALRKELLTRDGELIDACTITEELRKELEQVKGERDRYRDALEVYHAKGHHDTCSHALSSKYDCDCGYELANTALEGK